MSKSKTPESNPERFRRDVIERLLAAWEQMPALRLCQLLSNAHSAIGKVDIFYTEDADLVEIVEKYTSRYTS